MSATLSLLALTLTLGQPLRESAPPVPGARRPPPTRRLGAPVAEAASSPAPPVGRDGSAPSPAPPTGSSATPPGPLGRAQPVETVPDEVFVPIPATNAPQPIGGASIEGFFDGGMIVEGADAGMWLPHDAIDGGCCPALGPGESASYFMIVFGSTTVFPHRPSPHCFAAVVRVVHHPVLERPARIDTVTLSWYPDREKVAFVGRAERGMVRNLKDSIDRAVQLRSKIAAWGPYAIDPELFHKADRQLAWLESGQCRWRAFDTIGRRSGKVLNCVHAVSDADTDHGLLNTWHTCGIAAAEKITRHFQRFVVDDSDAHEWIWDELDLGGTAILRKPPPKRHRVIRLGPPRDPS